MNGKFAIALLTALATASAIQPIEIQGNAFYNGTDRFYIRGVDYQPGGSSNVTDPLADVANCKRDVPFFQDLGLNAIRVYTVDNSANHDECMSMLEDAGIYLLLDVNTPKVSINSGDPAPSYNADYLQAIFATVDAFSKYNNTFGFFAGNEVINNVNTTGAAPYVKAVVRDLKEYISKQAPRPVPVGYSAADISQNRWQQMEYFNCGSSNETIDLFGMNDYSWCGASSFQISGYQANVEAYGNYSIPMFFSEYGCNTVGDEREFTEVPVIYSDEMSSVYSGGLVYEYSEESNHYGLVQINGNEVTKRPDYDNFKSQLANSPDPTGAAGATTTRVPANCPSFQEGIWEVNGTAPLPPLPSGAQQYMEKGAGTGQGLGQGSTQFAGSDNSDSDSSSSSSSVAATGSSTSSAAASSTSKSKSKAAAADLAPSAFMAVLVTALSFVGLF